MRRLHLAGLSASMCAATLLAGACGDSTFSSSPNAVIDGGNDDSAIPIDGSFVDHALPVDGSAGGDASDLPGCATHHDLCDDFEDTGSDWPLSRWDDATQTSAFTFVTPGSNDAGHALFAHDLPDSGNSAPALAKLWTRSMTTLRCEVDLLVDTAPPANLVEGIVTVYLSSGSTGSHTFFAIQAQSNPPSWIVGIGANSSTNNSVLGPLTIGQWQHASFVLTPSQSSVRIDMPGVGDIDDTKSPVVTPIDSASITLGLDPADPSWRVKVDNFVCDASP